MEAAEIETLERARDTSGHNNADGAIGPIFQQWLKHEPFWMIVACMLVNMTHWKQARPVFDWMRQEDESNKDPNWFLTVDREWLEEHIECLGFVKRRSNNLISMAEAWIKNPPETRDDIMDLPGCGKYAADTWSIFIENRTDVNPTDKDLRWYMENVVGKEA